MNKLYFFAIFSLALMAGQQVNAASKSFFEKSVETLKKAIEAERRFAEKVGERYSSPCLAVALTTGLCSVGFYRFTDHKQIGEMFGIMCGMAWGVSCYGFFNLGD